MPLTAVLQDVRDRRITQVRAAEILNLSTRQITRLSALKDWKDQTMKLRSLTFRSFLTADLMIGLVPVVSAADPVNERIEGLKVKQWKVIIR